VDGIGLTLYPYLQWDTPAQVPDDYLAPLAAAWDGPVLVTETAWPAKPQPPLGGGAQDQAAWVARLFEVTAALDLRVVDWLFLHDWDGQASQPAFAYTGLRSNRAAVVRPADKAWRQQVKLREE
jgi:hypothetical protein